MCQSALHRRFWLVPAFLAALSLTSNWPTQAATDPASSPAAPAPTTPAPASAATGSQPLYGATVRITGPTTPFHDSVTPHYNYAFGKETPFLPSNATSSTGQFVSPKSFY